MNHTPGKWNVDGCGNIFSDKSQRRCVANCNGYRDSSKTAQTIEENRANAQLISLAPELLEACKYAYKTIKWNIEDENLAERDKATLEQLKKAIERAQC